MEVTELKEATERLRKLKRRRDRAKRIEKQCSSDYSEQSYKVRKMLEAVDMERFDAEGITVSMAHKHSVKLDPMNREAFFDYLREQGLLDELITVNSQTLSKFVREKIEEQEAEGIIEPVVPGVVISEYEDLYVRTK